ncbi:MAG TPA: SNF2-related protein [Caulobacteraceae bacterium]|nr:SNF2-related protein [Caulobacteraceae bacterium]
MAILFFKADQLGLFDKLVPVKASVDKQGHVRAAHTAIRHVRAPQAPKHHHPEVQDLFAERAPAPKPAPKPRPKATAHQADLFSSAAAPPPAEPQGMTMAEVRAKREAGEAAERKGHEAVAEPAASPVMATANGAKSARDPAPDAQEAIAPAAPVEAAAVAPTAAGVDYSAGLPADLPAFGVAPGTSKAERRRLNADAAAMVREPKTLVDLDVLRQYSGWGGCGDSLNEFYTDRRVAAAMWAALTRLGLGAGAEVLEPSCGTGVFLAMAPAGVKVTGVEMDETSSKIAATLHPNAEVKNQALEAFATTDVRQFDAVIGNPPFGDTRGALVAADKPNIKRPEQYFVDTALDKAKPGGLVALVLPTGIMDASSARKLREAWICKGEFLGALRMPNTAFEASHTGVTTDVVFFRKRPDDVAGALSVLDRDTRKLLGAWDDEFIGGSYFTSRGAENVLGTMEAGWRAKAGMGDDITVEGSMIGVPEAIAEFVPEGGGGPASVGEILAAVKDKDLQAKVRGAAMRKPYDQAKRGDTRVIDGVTYVLEGEPLRWHRVDEFMAEKAVTDAGDLGAEIERAVQGEEVPGLADKVRAYVEAHGIPSKNPNLVIAARQDKNIYRLLGAVKPDGSLSDVVEGKRQEVASSFDAAAQTLALEVGFFTPSMVAGRWHNGTEETVLDHLYASPDYALDPVSGTWTSLDNYLSGELWPKLDEVKAALAAGEAKPEDRAKFERQAQALEEAIDPKSLEDVEIQINSGFIPPAVVAAWLNAKHGKGHSWQDVTIAYDEADSWYHVTGSKWGDVGLVEQYLNRDGVRKDDLPRIEAMNREFKDWLLTSAYRDDVEDDYNRKFRGFRGKAYSNTPFEVPGLKADGLKDYQWGGLRWALEAGKGIIAADVGLGKTARALILNKLLKSTGQAKRPMIIVPKSVAANWMKEAEKWFPGSSVMVIGETYVRDKKTGELKGKPDDAVTRNRKFHDIRQNDYDFILITQPAWNELDLDPDTKQAYSENDFWEKRFKTKNGKVSAKQEARMREAHEAKVAGQNFQSRTDALYFNDLGVDAIISDEMHAYKNLFEARDRYGKKPKFLGGSGNSKRAADMRWKTDWLRDQTGGRNIYGLTATPTKNSPLEVYSMLSHIAPEAFERIGIHNSEDFLDRFCTFEERNILDTSGRMTRDLCVTGFKNLDELRNLMRRYIDRKTAEDVGLQLPAKEDRQHLVEISAAQKEVYAELREMADRAKNAGSSASGEGHPFAIMSNMDKASLDLELYDPARYAGARSPKIEECVAKVRDGLADGGQIIFCDAVPAHDKIVRLLVEAGVPRDQIGVMNANVASTSAKRQNLADGYRNGKLKVMIGNSTMEEGVDGLQFGTSDIHHLNIPWTASAIQQRNGRAVRQGNTAEAIRLHTYLAKGTFDGYRYQTITAKRDWQDLLWNGGDRVENLAFEGGLSHEEMLIALSEDPDAAREELAKNKALAQAKLDAEQSDQAAEAFKAYRRMRQSFGKLKAPDREKPSGRRLAHKLNLAKASLEANPYFKAKGALDSDKPVALLPGSGEPVEAGHGLDIGDDGKITAGRYVVEKVEPVDDAQHGGWVHLRRWGDTSKNATLSVPLVNLMHAKPIEHDAAGEAAHIAEETSKALAAGAKDIKSYADLRRLPPAAVEANREAISKRMREAMAKYEWTHDGYDASNRMGVIGPDGPKSIPTYESTRALANGHEPMLPIAEHREAAFQAYAKDEAAKKWNRVAQHGPRGSFKGYEHELRYPGGSDQKSNAWEKPIRDLWGEEGVAEAHRRFEGAQLDAARHAPDLKTAIGHAAQTATRKERYGAARRGQWGRKALATLHAKAKAHNALHSPMVDHLDSKEVREWGGNVRQEPVGHENFPGFQNSDDVHTTLRKQALAGGHNDLAAAMALDTRLGPKRKAEILRSLPDHPSRTDALAHLAAKHPDLNLGPEETPRAA